jgi:hypothetical protein
MEPFVVVAVFALVITKLVDTIRNAIDPTARLPKVVWNVTAFVAGIAVCLIWSVNMLEQFGDEGVRGTAGEVLTGILLGAGGSAWHEVLDFLSGRKWPTGQGERRRV